MSKVTQFDKKLQGRTIRADCMLDESNRVRGPHLPYVIVIIYAFNFCLIVENAQNKGSNIFHIQGQWCTSRNHSHTPVTKRKQARFTNCGWEQNFAGIILFSKKLQEIQLTTDSTATHGPGVEIRWIFFPTFLRINFILLGGAGICLPEFCRP